MSGFDFEPISSSVNLNIDNDIPVDDSQINLQAVKRRFKEFLLKYYIGNFNYKYR